jgi:hypothetical protein
MIEVEEMEVVMKRPSDMFTGIINKVTEESTIEVTVRHEDGNSETMVFGLVGIKLVIGPDGGRNEALKCLEEMVLDREVTLYTRMCDTIDSATIYVNYENVNQKMIDIGQAIAVMI